MRAGIAAQDSTKAGANGLFRTSTVRAGRKTQKADDGDRHDHTGHNGLPFNVNVRYQYTSIKSYFCQGARVRVVLHCGTRYDAHKMVQFREEERKENEVS
jgi:hypothetical protein